MATKKCPHCGIDIDEQATRCYSCKRWVSDTPLADNSDKPKEFLPTALFAMFLGVYGLHRFYTGNLITGLAQLVTFGGCGIWAMIDFIMICFNKFRDGKGRLLANYDQGIGIILFVIVLIPFLLMFLCILGVILAIALPSMMK